VLGARRNPRRSLGLGLPLLLVCLAALESALFAKALWLFLVGTVVGGIAVGLIFRGGLSEINRLAEPRNRAATVSTFFVAAYLGLGLPAVLTGVISQATGTVDASVYVSVLAATFVVAAIIVVLRTFGSATASEPSSTPSDAWCCPEDPDRWGERLASAPGSASGPGEG
jgi:predicted MFS family arabinose efflux permease